jgi:Tfp pilus assembly protein PilX
MRIRTSAHGGTLLMVAVIGVITALIVVAMVSSLKLGSKTASVRRTCSSALNLAEAGKEDALARLRKKTVTPTASQRVGIISQTTLNNGTYAVSCSSDAAKTNLWLLSTGTAEGCTAQIAIEATYIVNGFDLSWVKGAITAKCTVNVSGNCAVDGRDWDTTGPGSPAAGKDGVWSCKDVSTDGSSAIGGNGAAPPHPSGEAAGSVEEGQSCASFPSSVEALLGLTVGSLDSYKKTPAQFNAMTKPFHGIVWVTASCGPVDFESSTGIMIVHNSASTAQLQTNGGTFKGVLIVDDMKANGNFEAIGATFLLNATKGSNGGADLKYSSKVLNNLSNYTANQCAAAVVQVTSWKQL